MNGKGIALMAIAVVAIGTFALPSTVSLFSGQHTWYDLSGRENNVPCEKCHADIAEEMEALAGPHTGETGYGRFKCDYCHRTFDLNDYGGLHSQNINQSIFSNYYYTYASGNGTEAEPGKEAHAASTVPCMYCHSGEDSGFVADYCSHTFTSKSCTCHGTSDTGQTGDWREYYYHGDRFYTGTSDDDPGECIKCHLTGNADVRSSIYVPPAGGFNLTANSSDTGELAAHKTFVQNAISNTDMEDANEACIACHTGIPVNITWKHAHDLNFTATWEGGLFPTTPTHFNVSDWQANGTVTNHSYGYGNGTGSTSSSGWYQGE